MGAEAMRRCSITLVLVASSGALLSCGCIESHRTQNISPTSSPSRPDPPKPLIEWRQEDEDGFSDRICDLVSFFPLNTWKSFDPEGDRNVEGFAFVLYLIACDSRKGAYSNGLVHVNMYRVETGPDGKSTRELVQNWTARHDELNPRQPTRLGYGYQPHLFWGENVDVLGKEVEIVVQFEAPDGRVIQGQTVHRKVPGRKI